MRIKMIATAAALVLALAPAALAQERADAPHAAHDTTGPWTAEKVLTKLHMCNLTEIELAELAVRKSNNDAVGEYAKMLKDDHKALDQKIKDLAKALNIDIDHGSVRPNQVPAQTQQAPSPAKPESATSRQPGDEHQVILRKLDGFSGDEFNREYTTKMARDHRHMLMALAEAKSEVPEDQVKRLIMELEPKLTQHQQRASELSRQFGGNPEAPIDPDTTPDPNTRDPNQEPAPVQKSNEPPQKP